MSDLDGERAFDLITERMLDLNSRLDAVSRERDEARGVNYELERQVRSFESRMQSAAAAAARYKAMVPPDVLAAAEAKLRSEPDAAADPDIPF